MQNLWQFYLLIGIILLQGAVFVLGPKVGKIFFLILCFIELSFIAGFRDWSIGNDTFNYIQTFILSLNYPELLRVHSEKGFLLFNRLLGSVSPNPQILLITTSLFVIGSYLWSFYKYSVETIFSVLLFVVLEFSTTLSMMRQEIALCIILLSVPFIVHRKFIPFLLCCIIGMFFHTSTAAALLLYPLYSVEFRPKYFFPTLIICVVVLFFLAPILDHIINLTNRYETYKGNILLGEETKIASILKMSVQLVIAGFCYFTYKYFGKQNLGKHSKLAISFLLWCSFAAFCFHLVSIRGTVIERIALYFSMFNFISLPFFVSCYPKKMRVPIAISLLCCFILYQSIIFVYRPQWNAVLPFKFCF